MGGFPQIFVRFPFIFKEEGVNVEKDHILKFKENAHYSITHPPNFRIVLCLFLKVQWTGLQSVIVELNPGHIHLLIQKVLNVSVFGTSNLLIP